ncbi:phosphoribosylaminoimidazolesuccinocarboxamide synthase, partial [Salmonella enterica subsp. enterica serovar Typhimurium]|nr:phosphoribosylaminoimidazolesuccinocarboxamide synthase [Salmonella enterica subsp. enterica serovar Typhimurium]
YLTGTGLKEYQRSGTVCGIELPEGLVDGSRLESPIFTPTGKAEVGEHDEAITYEEMTDAVGRAMGERI